LIFFVIIAGANQMVNPFLQKEYGIDLAQAGNYTTLWGIGAVLGGVGGGWLMRRLGDRRGTVMALFVSLISVMALSFITSPGMAWPIVFIFGVAYSSYQTVYFALSMGYTDLHIAASMFAILMAMSNIGQGIGMGLGGALADGIGFRWTFVIFALLNLLALPLLPLVFKKKK
jgi:predicted MFS family arabinose efflux permease